MLRTERLLWSIVVCLAFAATAARPVHAQEHGKSKHYAVTTSRAVTVTRTVLTSKGYTVVRVEQVGPTQIVYYRRGNMGRGKGKGPLQRMVIRQVHDRVLFEETEPSVMVDIDVKLKI